MSFFVKLSDETLYELVAHHDPNVSIEAKRVLRDRVRINALRRLRGRRGTCSEGRRVIMDDGGAYSSGYIDHPDGPGNSICTHTVQWSICTHPVQWDDYTPEQKYARHVLDMIQC